MYDRPSARELIEAARQHLETQIIPMARGTQHKLYFQTLVAANVLRIVERELALGTQQRRDHWARLDAILGAQPLPPSDAAIDAGLRERNQRFCAAIRAGDYDRDAQVFAHLKAFASEQLAVANPRFLATLAAEDEAARK